MAAPPVNAQDRRFREEMIRLFDMLGLDDTVRAIILTGQGHIFCAGADLRERPAILSEPGGYARHNRLVRAAFDVITECPKPVIAAVNGPAIGGGAALALLSDILIVAEEAYLAFPEVDHGLAGGARHVMRCFSPSNARLMIYTSQEMTGRDLYRMNVASACVPKDALLTAALQVAHDIAAKAPLAIEAAKASFGFTEEMPLRDGYRYEQGQTASLARTEDTREALAAFAEKRKPVFRGRRPA
jgi:enoyl-CoA hydratase/carnithine racemase